jgi:hypothetical protein
VERTFVRQTEQLVTITTEDGCSIEATEEHPFWVEGKGFIAARRLARSDLLRNARGESVRVEQVSIRAWRGTVYNFEVEDTHTYFVGSVNSGIWVHNTCFPTAEQLQNAYIAATAPYKSGPLSAAGRALTKHNSVARPGSAFPVPKGNAGAINDLAHEVVGDILANPNTVRVERGPVFDIVAPDGRGLRFHSNGTLKGFLEPGPAP